jgi:hydroxyacylglutathione hydrolase
MIIEYKAVPPFYKNGYLLSFDNSTDALLIDPGDEVDLLLGMAEIKKLSIQYIFLTHGHLDHISGVGHARSKTNAPIVIHPDDLKLYNTVELQAEWFNYPVEKLPKVDAFFADQQIFTIAGCEIKVLHTPGHSPGGVCFLINNDLFCGDTLFEGSVGRADLPGGDFAKLIASVKTRLLILPDTTVVYPGHGPSTTIGDEKKFNPFIND